MPLHYWLLYSFFEGGLQAVSAVIRSADPMACLKNIQFCRVDERRSVEQQLEGLSAENWSLVKAGKAREAQHEEVDCLFNTAISKACCTRAAC